MESRILLIYTGGTIGSVTRNGGLAPIDFAEITRHVPELEQPGRLLVAEAFDPPLDSSDVGPAEWARLASLVRDRYTEFDGFVILHGTDTLAYTASALSFMFKGLAKPVILTGSQLPIGLPRTDGRENLLTAVELATASSAGRPLIREVAVYFGSALYRGNRTHKESAESLQAIVSPNYPPLASAGVDLAIHRSALFRDAALDFGVNTAMETRVVWLPLFPGLSPEAIARVTEWQPLRGLVLSTFGSGNAPSSPALRDLLAAAHDRGVVTVNVTQCGHGGVHPERYATGHMLLDVGVVPGGDMTTEAALTKLMHLLATHSNPAAVRSGLLADLRGERSPD